MLISCSKQTIYISPTVDFSLPLPSSDSYLVMPFMGTDLGKLMKMERLSEEKVQYLVYQMLKGLKVETLDA